MAALVKGFCNDCRFYSRNCVRLHRAGNVVLMPQLCVSRCRPLLSGPERCAINSLAICFGAVTPESQCQHCSAPDFPAVVVERGAAQLLISCVSSSFSQPKACRAGGGRERRKRELKCPLFSPLPAEGFIEMFFFILRSPGGTKAFACPLTHTPTLSPFILYICMSVCERKRVSERGQRERVHASNSTST